MPPPPPPLELPKAQKQLSTLGAKSNHYCNPFSETAKMSFCLSGIHAVTARWTIYKYFETELVKIRTKTKSCKGTM